MALKVFWTDFAKSSLHEIFDYYKNKAGVRISHKLIEGIIKSTEILLNQPLTGQKEEMLNDRSEGFRYLIYKNYKIIYWINQSSQKIEIVDVFDTRQDPLKIKKG
jgi:plasmid stabilization system protein ParE